MDTERVKKREKIGRVYSVRRMCDFAYISILYRKPLSPANTIVISLNYSMVYSRSLIVYGSLTVLLREYDKCICLLAGKCPVYE